MDETSLNVEEAKEGPHLCLGRRLFGVMERLASFRFDLKFSSIDIVS